MMTKRHLDNLFGKLAERSVERGGWERSTRVFQASACGLKCIGRLRVSLLAQGGVKDHVAGDIEIWLISPGAVDDASVYSSLRFAVRAPSFQSLAPLFDATFQSAEAQLRSSAAFVAMQERRQLDALLARRERLTEPASKRL